VTLVRRPVAAAALVLGTTALLLAVTTVSARAAEAPTNASAPSSNTASGAPGASAAPNAPAPDPKTTSALTAAPPTVIVIPGTSAAAPVDAAVALANARAAYEYGEMEMVVDSARLVAEGRLHPTPAERAQALRYLGIGLFLTDRQEGAETAFFDLLRLQPRTRLDATTTRPDVVAFFESVRRRHAGEINEAAKNRPGKSLALAFLPPLGQFQSGHKARGITLAALEVLSFGGALATDLQLHAWDTAPGQTFGTHHDAAETFKTLNWISVAVLATTIVVGIVDGVANYVAAESEGTGTSVADVLGRGLTF
jgi:hypothetical protein